MNSKTATQTIGGFVMEHTVRGACTCGKCCDAPPNPESHQPTGHTADVFFFQVAKHGEPSADEFRRLTAEHRGAFCDCNPLEGEHSYMELGGWIGDQGLALQYMGLGALLGVFQLMTPKMLPGLPEDLMQQMAGMGMVSVLPAKARTQEA